MDSESEQDHSSMGSLVHVRASDVFPKKIFQTDDPTLQITFALLHGEAVDYMSHTAEGVITITNYRVFIQLKDHFYNIPLGLIDSIECKEISLLYISGKDAKTYRCAFSTNEQCLDWHKKLVQATFTPQKLEDLFALSYHAWGTEEGVTEMQSPTPVDTTKSMFKVEVERLGFDLTSTWRISTVNENYTMCSSYPIEILVPATIEDKVILKLSQFRASKRIPAVVWRHRGNGCVIARCSQPEMGWMGWRNYDDEKLIQDIALASSYNGGTNSDATELVTAVPSENPADPRELQMVRSRPQMKTLIVDARSYAAAFTNRAKGGGYECQEYYPNCEIQYMNLANIHSIRKSFQMVRTASAVPGDVSNWLSLLENTRWLANISGLLKAACVVCQAIDQEERPVLVHCSDGWDRTSQIVGLAELLLDPYYRTIHGFEVLVEKEWLEFGHKFGDRCGLGLRADDANERSPVFLQWLDCIHQLLNQFPISFEFNHQYLMKLVQHTYSGLFGTFLCNNSSERNAGQLSKRTYSVWKFLRNNEIRFKNHLYLKNESVLRPSHQIKDLKFWSAVYTQANDPKDAGGTAVAASGTSPPTEIEEGNLGTNSSPQEDLIDASDVAGAVGLPKTRSCTDLLTLTDHSVDRHRRLSDPHAWEAFPNSAEVVSAERVGGEHSGSELVNGLNSANNIDLTQQGDILNGHEQEIHINGAGSAENEDSTPDTQNGLDFHINGHINNEISDDEDAEECRRRKVIETSTDTLVGELATETKPENSLENNRSIPLFSDLFKTQDGSVHCSTSTTEISNSTIRTNINKGPHSRRFFTTSPNIPNLVPPPSSTNFNGVDHTTSNGNGTVYGPQYVKCMLCTNGLINANVQRHFDALKSLTGSSNVSAAGSSSSGNGIRSPGSAATPLRTPSSGFPATPSEDKSTEVYSRYNSSSSSSYFLNTAAPLTPQNLERKSLDIDGLSIETDEIQQRLCTILNECLQRENLLRHKLSLAQAALYQQVCQRCNSGRGGAEIMDEVGSQPDSVGSYGSEHQSVGHDSMAASDLSWETVDEQDTRPTLWEPDHVVNRCPSCDHEFCLMRRKHHCRSCGRIFCSDCSNQEMPVPNEQLYDPVRVCSECFSALHGRQQQLISVDPRFSKAIYAATPAYN